MAMTREQIIEKWGRMSSRERDAWVEEVVQPPVPSVLCFYVLPHYTTDISAAWEVVEVLRKDWLVQLHDCDPFGWRIELISDSEYRTDLNGVVVRKVEEAICLAALIAKLTKEESA
ncbi:BC1872 family protein [Paenibacillus dendritiformis]|uniref:BC1872 family protein n=1 Tax=Paenibacillus dendritiformis TaxID=130049 RepID=UPI00387E133D